MLRGKPLYIKLSFIESASALKKWLIPCNASVRGIGWHREEMAEIVVSNKKAKKTIEACEEMENKFNIVKDEFIIFEEAYAEVDLSKLVIHLKITVKEEITRRA